MLVPVHQRAVVWHVVVWLIPCIPLHCSGLSTLRLSWGGDHARHHCSVSANHSPALSSLWPITAQRRVRWVLLPDLRHQTRQTCLAAETKHLLSLSLPWLSILANWLSSLSQRYVCINTGSALRSCHHSPRTFYNSNIFERWTAWGGWSGRAPS